MCHHYLFWQTPVLTSFIGCCIKLIFFSLYCIVHMLYFIINSFNFKMPVNNVYPLKLIQSTKHMQYCILNIQRIMCITVEFLHLKINKVTWLDRHQTKMNEVFYVEENFTLMWWVILSLRKLLQTAIHWQNQLFLTLESLTFHFCFLDSVLQTKKHAVTSLECAHSITWY